MRKITVILFTLCAFAFAQDKPKVAVYVANSDLPESETKVFTTKMSAAFVNSGKYREIARGYDFLAKVNEERKKQHSGSVDDNQISRLGIEAGAQFVCVVDITKAFNLYNISARLIDVETVETERLGEIESQLSSSEDLTNSATRVFSKMHERTAVEKEAERELERQKEEQARQEREKERQTKLDTYQDFTQLERFGTFALNHVFGLGSLLIMENTGTAGWIALFEAIGVTLYVFGSSVKMPDRNSYDDDSLGEDDYETDRKLAVGSKYALIVSGLVALGSIEIANAVSSFTYNKPKPVAGFADPRNFHLAVLPNRDGNGMAYGLMYNVRF